MKRFVSVWIILLCLAPAAWAMWVNIPLEEVIQKSPVVVVGKIEKIDVADPADRAQDTAHIRVARILKNELETEIEAEGEILLVMPSKNRKVKASTDLVYDEGAEGVWILETDDEGKTFAVNYPKDFQPLDKEEEIAGIIAEQKPE